ncbi:hypothetical protein [Natrinema halophilum]|uniref:hypothetical protein n=1 Tax=Natrinema halophilum TaxID=1699371 RepID=UPI001F3F9F3A|nr:hypothetical protein [Natrinema halophilum]UHQ96387.1 hypothetical protein HYG82_22320 [Natrinema halophilum]
MLPGTVPILSRYQVISLALAGMLFVYLLAGLWAYRKRPVLCLVFVPLTPVAVLVHSIGALWGLIRPVETVEVTEKVTPETIENVHESLDEGDLSAHDRAERLLQESDTQFQVAGFDD